MTQCANRLDKGDHNMAEGAAPRFGLVLDCADPELLAQFWGNALGYVNVGSAGAYVVA